MSGFLFSVLMLPLKLLAAYLRWLFFVVLTLALFAFLANWLSGVIIG